jgi:glutamyl-Q tRNA(Asp) synthetase
MPAMSYVGRFAPSPTGPLHFGSLLAAVGSWCDARANGGRWLLRIEDTDPPRAMSGADSLIRLQLEAYGMEWDGPVLSQSTRSEAYLAALDQLHSQGDVFWCRCSRGELARLGSNTYPGHCRPYTSPRDDAALRLHVPDDCVISFRDIVFGHQRETVCESVGDFVLRRRDGLFSYQLAVVVDDAFQGVTCVVRGADLLDNTARQILLQQRLALPTPEYMHLPLAMNADGSKLSKQNLAAPLPLPADPHLLWLALKCLGQAIPAGAPAAACHEILAWGSTHWRPEAIPTRPVTVAR